MRGEGALPCASADGRSLQRQRQKRLAILERVKKECDMLSSVKHPNIVQFMGVYFDEGNPLPVLVIEFVPFTLSQHLEDP